MGATMGRSGGHFLDALPLPGTFHVVMLGLDSAGKTTALYRLKFDQYLNTVPTIGFNCEKVYGTVGKAKGIQFLVWDVGGQEKLRPLWRSYTRCTDGILFVVDSVDRERMEEAKMELMRTAKSPDNQGVPVLILANKQDLPGALEPTELENLLGLHELAPLYPNPHPKSMSYSSRSASNVASKNSSGCNGRSSGVKEQNTQQHSVRLMSTAQHNQTFLCNANNSISSSSGMIVEKPPSQQYNSTTLSASATALNSTQHTTVHRQQQQQYSVASRILQHSQHYKQHSQTSHDSNITATLEAATTKASSSSSLLAATDNTEKTSNNKHICGNKLPVTAATQFQFKGWYIQPACAITGDGLQEGLEALYEMIMKRRKFNKTHKKRR